MHFYARQGDLVFNRLPGELQVLSRLPDDKELKPASGLVLSGTDSDPHTVAGLALVHRDGRGIFLRGPETTEVAHAGRHLAISLEAGDYEVYPLRERGDRDDRAVED